MNESQRKKWESDFQKLHDEASRRRSTQRSITLALTVTLCLMIIPLVLKAK